jgi:hypothetical protein
MSKRHRERRGQRGGHDQDDDDEQAHEHDVSPGTAQLLCAGECIAVYANGISSRRAAGGRADGLESAFAPI